MSGALKAFSREQRLTNKLALRHHVGITPGHRVVRQQAGASWRNRGRGIAPAEVQRLAAAGMGRDGCLQRLATAAMGPADAAAALPVRVKSSGGRGVATHHSCSALQCPERPGLPLPNVNTPQVRSRSPKRRGGGAKRPLLAQRAVGAGAGTLLLGRRLHLSHKARPSIEAVVLV